MGAYLRYAGISGSVGQGRGCASCSSFLLTSDIFSSQDKMRVEMIDRWLTVPAADLDPRTYQLILEWIRQIGYSHKPNLQLLSQCCECLSI